MTLLQQVGHRLTPPSRWRWTTTTTCSAATLATARCWLRLASRRPWTRCSLAAAVANELEGRLSTACLLGPLNGQMSSYIHNAGAALAVGKVRGLDAGQLADAVALALYQPNTCLAAGF